ncbi:MAG: DinB family protein [Thermoanaerobaculia bacterium]|nr:DinB family protein [Thermoanaerobaculia bacterium]
MNQIAQSLLPELDQEMSNTRKALERIPEDRMGWKPHEKSFTQGRLASHLAELPSWGTRALTSDSFDIAPPDAESEQALDLDERDEILDHFDRSVEELRTAVEDTSDDRFMEPWTLLRKGVTVFSLPRIGVLRTFVLNHMCHHRGQLTVYLRLTDTPVPALYGPSADEGAMP